MGDDLSFFSGAALFVVALLVVKDYWPSNWRFWANMPPPTMLQFGIFLGFFLTATNTLWWQMLNTVVVDLGWLTRAQFQDIGKFMDVPLKGGMAVAGMIHLRAKQKMKNGYDPRT